MAVPSAETDNIKTVDQLPIYCRVSMTAECIRICGCHCHCIKLLVPHYLILFDKVSLQYVQKRLKNNTIKQYLEIGTDTQPPINQQWIKLVAVKDFCVGHDIDFNLLALLLYEYATFIQLISVFDSNISVFLVFWFKVFGQKLTFKMGLSSIKKAVLILRRCKNPTILKLEVMLWCSRLYCFENSCYYTFTRILSAGKRPTS